MEDETIIKLRESVEKLNTNLERQTSFKFVILRGFVYGVSIVISLLNNVPVIEGIIDRYMVEDSQPG
jgi:hypothetical protein